MFRPLELAVGLRYTRAKRRNHFISFISLTSMGGIALGVTALITVLSVMNGFQAELRERILGMAAHATIESPTGSLRDWREVLSRVQQDPTVVAAAPYVTTEVMMSQAGRVSGAQLRGVDPDLEGRVSVVAEHMVAGELAALRPGEYGIVLGRELAWSLGAEVGDAVTVITPQAVITPAGMLPRLRRFTVVGLFRVGMYEYDRGVALVHMADAARLLRLDDAASGVRLRLEDMFAAPLTARRLADRLPGAYRVQDWTQQHGNYFRAVQAEKRVMFVILTLIVAVAVFNIVSTLVMLVTDKQADIAILRTLGMPPLSVMAVFVIQGCVIGVIGTAAGVAGGVALALNVETIVPAIERAFDIQFLPADVYYISDLPSKLEWTDVWRVGGVALVLSLIATLYPAWRAARTQPAEALRYE